MTLFLCLPHFFSPCFLIKSTFFFDCFPRFPAWGSALPPLSNEFLLFPKLWTLKRLFFLNLLLVPHRHYLNKEVHQESEDRKTNTQKRKMSFFFLCSCCRQQSPTTLWQPDFLFFLRRCSGTDAHAIVGKAFPLSLFLLCVLLLPALFFSVSVSICLFFFILFLCHAACVCVCSHTT